jgi:hypothetical protein
MNTGDKSTTWKISNSLWIILSFVFLLHWSSLLYAGLKVKNRLWVLFSMVYFFPILIYIISPPQYLPDKTLSAASNLKIIFFVLSWLGTIIHSFVIRKQYLELLEKKQLKMLDQNKSKAVLKMNERLVEELLMIKDEIYSEIDKSTNFSSDIIDEIRPLVIDYIEQSKELLERDAKLQQIARQFSIEETNKNILDLSNKLLQTKNEELKKEYHLSIQKYDQHKKSFLEINEQRELIKLRLDSIKLSMKEIKLNLTKLEGIVTMEMRNELLKPLEEKSQELKEYIKALKESYA